MLQTIYKQPYVNIKYITDRKAALSPSTISGPESMIYKGNLQLRGDEDSKESE